MLQTTFAPDCQIEMDLEILIIDDYVSNIAERINLYNELDNCETEEEWTNFEKELIDRFGPVPESTKEMILALRLRWVGKAIGIEKLELKQNKLIGYFIVNQDSLHYQSPLLTKVLNFVQKNQNLITLKERKNLLSLVFENVKTILKALGLLRRV